MVAVPARSASTDPTPESGEIHDSGAKSLATPARQKDTARYVADMILELRNLAKAARLHSVMVPLEYAYYEAFTAANRVEAPPAEIARINGLSRALMDLEDSTPDDY